MSRTGPGKEDHTQGGVIAPVYSGLKTAEVRVFGEERYSILYS